MNKVLSKFILFVLLTVLSIQAFGESTEEIYDRMLDEHTQNGHLSEESAQNLKYKFRQNQTIQKDLNKQVRGIASTMKKNSQIMQFKNPDIEIPVK